MLVGQNCDFRIFIKFRCLKNPGQQPPKALETKPDIQSAKAQNNLCKSKLQNNCSSEVVSIISAICYLRKPLSAALTVGVKYEPPQEKQPNNRSRSTKVSFTRPSHMGQYFVSDIRQTLLLTQSSESQTDIIRSAVAQGTCNEHNQSLMSKTISFEIDNDL